MPDATVAVDRLQTFQIRLNFAPQIALDRKLARSDRMDDVVKLLRRQILRTDVRLDVRLFEDLLRGARADPVNVWQRCVDALVAGDFNS